jgi:hypothetical protein
MLDKEMVALRGKREPVANDEHLAGLRQGTAVWNEWGERNPIIVPDLQNADLREAYLSAANLSEANLRAATLDRANLGKANLIEANLTGAYLAGANLSSPHDLPIGAKTCGMRSMKRSALGISCS